jgi:hypothetical protein
MNNAEDPAEPKDSAPEPPASHDLDAIKKAVALINGGKTPQEVEASRRVSVRSTTEAFTPPFKGYSWDPATLDAVMKRTGIADAKALIQTAIALDQNARYLDGDRLLKAARDVAAPIMNGFKWSPSTLADIMQKTGIAEETALLRMAKRLDDGDRFLDENELMRAANILNCVVDAHDFVAITKRLDNLRGRDDIEHTTLGYTKKGLPVDMVRFPSAKQPPAMRVTVTGGVHGDEPCGAASALLLIEQLAANPAMRMDIEWVIIPVGNPEALVSGTRELLDKRDLNREAEDDPSDPVEADFVQSAHKQFPPDLAIDLHSGAASRNGFWVIHENGEDIAPQAITRFGSEWPLLHGDVKTYAMEAPGIATSDNPGTLKSLAIDAGARWAFTVEAPGSVAYREQVLGENDIVHQLALAARAKIG